LRLFGHMRCRLIAEPVRCSDRIIVGGADRARGNPKEIWTGAFKKDMIGEC